MFKRGFAPLFNNLPPPLVREGDKGGGSLNKDLIPAKIRGQIIDFVLPNVVYHSEELLGAWILITERHSKGLLLSRLTYLDKHLIDEFQEFI